MNTVPEQQPIIITVDRLTPALTFAITTENEPFLRRENGKNSQTLLALHYNNALSRAISGWRCTVYVGDYPEYDGSYASTQGKPIPKFIEIKEIDHAINTPAVARQLLSEQKGFSADFNVEISTNPQGMQLASGNFTAAGSKSYHYIIVMGDRPVLIENADWVDPNSIALSK